MGSVLKRSMSQSEWEGEVVEIDIDIREIVDTLVVSGMITWSTFRFDGTIFIRKRVRS